MSALVLILHDRIRRPPWRTIRSARFPPRTTANRTDCGNEEHRISRLAIGCCSRARASTRGGSRRFCGRLVRRCCSGCAWGLQCHWGSALRSGSNSNFYRVTGSNFQTCKGSGW